MIHAEYLFLKLVAMVLFLIVVVTAFRAARQHNSQPLLFVAFGFIFIALGTGLEGVLFHFEVLSLYQASLVHTAFMILGMTCIVYSIYGKIGTGLQPTEVGEVQ